MNNNNYSIFSIKVEILNYEKIQDAFAVARLARELCWPLVNASQLIQYKILNAVNAPLRKGFQSFFSRTETLQNISVSHFCAEYNALTQIAIYGQSRLNCRYVILPGVYMRGSCLLRRCDLHRLVLIFRSELQVSLPCSPPTFLFLVPAIAPEK